MTAIDHHAAPHPVEDRRAVLMLVRTAEFSDHVEVLDELARSFVPSEVLRMVAHNPATSEYTLEHLSERDQRWLTYPVTRPRPLTPEISDRIARRLTARNAILHAYSAPN